MKNAFEIREAFNLIIKGLNTLAELLGDVDVTSSSNEAVDPAETRGNSAFTNESKEVEVPVESKSEDNGIELDNLDDYSYNELKKIAKELGLSAKGTKSELVERIKEPQGTAVAVEPDTSVSPSADEVVEANEGSDLVTKVNEAVAEMSDEELADLLVSCGISASGKRKALIDKVVNAVREGVIDFDDEDEDDLPESNEVNEAPVPPTPEVVNEDELEFEFESPSGLNNPDTETMTTGRRDAIYELIEKTVESITDENMAEQTMIMSDCLVEYGYEKKEVNELSFVDLLNYYIDTKAMFIDDEGETKADEEPYMVNEVPYCCGYELKLVDNTFICETCGAEYEAEE